MQTSKESPSDATLYNWRKTLLAFRDLKGFVTVQTPLKPYRLKNGCSLAAFCRLCDQIVMNDMGVSKGVRIIEFASLPFGGRNPHLHYYLNASVDGDRLAELIHLKTGWPKAAFNCANRLVDSQPVTDREKLTAYAMKHRQKRRPKQFCCMYSFNRKWGFPVERRNRKSVAKRIHEASKAQYQIPANLMRPQRLTFEKSKAEPGKWPFPNARPFRMIP